MIHEQQQQQQQEDPYVDHFPDMRTFNSTYRVGDLLGEGNFAEVRVAHTENGSLYAAKIITKAKLTIQDDLALRDEIGALNTLNHNNIIQLYDVFDENDYYYLVTELMRGGDLFDRIVTKVTYNEREARDVCRILFQAIEHCHEHNIAHRDLKPENILLVSRHNDAEIKIADFGFAKSVTSKHCLKTQCGTRGYVSPEVLFNVPYGTKSDMWSLGVIIYTLLGGYPPFSEEDDRELFRKIKRGEYVFHEEYWSEISPEAKNLICNLLTVNPDQRITAHDALETPWVTGRDEDMEGYDLEINLQQFKKYNAKRKLRQAVLTLIAANKMTSLGYQFRSFLSQTH